MPLLLLLAVAAANALPVEVAIQVGHSKNQWIRDVAFLPSGRHVVTAGSGAFLWEVQSGRQLRAFRGQTGDLATVAISPDGRTIATGSFDHSIRIYDLETGRLLAKKELENGIQSVAFSPDGKSLAVARYGAAGESRNSIALIALQGAQLGEQRELDCIYAVQRVQFSADGLRIACASEYKARIVKTADGAQVGGDLKQRSGAFHPKQALYAYAEDGKLMLRDLDTGADRTVADAPAVRDGPVVRFSGDGRRLLVGRDVLDTTTWKPLMAAGDGRVGALSPDGETLATMQGNSGGLYNVGTGKLIRAFDSSVFEVHGVATSPDGRYLVTAGTPARLWDLSRGRPVRSLGTVEMEKAIFFDDARQLALLSSERSVQLCDVESGQTRTLPLKDYSAIAVDAKGKLLAAVSGERLALVSLPRGKLVKSVPVDKPALSVAVSSDGQTIVTGHSDGKVLVWSARGKKLGEALNTTADETVYSLAISHSGALLAAGSGTGETVLWSLPSLKRLSTLAFESTDSFRWPTALAFSADDATLAAAHEDRRTRLWDVASGKLLKTLTGHDYSATGVAFQAPNRVFTSSEDRSVKLWNTDTGEVIATFLAMARDGYAIYTPDNSYTISRGVGDSISFVRGLEAYPFDSFDLIFNRPDILVERLQVAPRAVVDAYQAAHARRVRLMGFTESTLSADMHLPEARFTGDKPALEVATRKLLLGVAASDSQYRLDRINLSVNGVPVFGQAGYSLVDQKTGRFEKAFEVELSQGANFIEVSAHNEKGIESARQELEVRYLGPQAPAATWVVSFGVSKYADHNYDLNYAAKDAADVARTLRQVRAGTQAKVFSDAQVTRESLAEARRFLEQSGVDDTVVVFVAGHGLLADDFSYYFASADTNFDKPQERAIAYEKLDGLLDGLKARKKLLLIDTCNSGEVEKEAMTPIKLAEGSIVPHGSRGIKQKYKLSLSETQGLLTELFADLRRGTGAVVISSAGGAEYALESAQWKNGVFTFALIEALNLRKGADANRDRQLQVSELRDHVSRRVTELTRGAQKPTVRRDNLYVDFPLAGELKAP